ncbi:WD40 repeat domain-containing protein, partial [Streptomyces rochei]|uniref:WD40 repeat domain-containing protein n=1 Tax=Streptomyces rochei TaxID=1928 RepID=UPI0036FFED92
VWRYQLPEFTQGARFLPVDRPDGLLGSARALAVSPHDSSIVLAGFRGSALWRRPNGQDWAPGPPLPAATAVAFSPVSARLATGDDRGLVRLLRGPSYDGPPSDLIGHTGAITAMGFSSDGSLLATASTDGTVRLWNTSEMP